MGLVYFREYGLIIVVPQAMNPHIILYMKIEVSCYVCNEGQWQKVDNEIGPYVNSTNTEVSSDNKFIDVIFYRDINENKNAL